MDIAQFKNRHKQEQPTTKIPFYKKLSRQKWFKILRPILIIGLFLLAIYILTILGIFQIKKIEHPKNLQYVTNWEQSTNQYLGQGYFSLDLEELKQSIKDNNGYVKEITAQKIFPNTIHLQIQEHIPTYTLEYKDICYIFCSEGELLESKEEYNECAIEKGIVLSTDENIIADNKLIFDTQIVDITKVLKEFAFETKNILVDQDLLTFSDGPREISIEGANNFDSQIAKLYLILEKVNTEGIEYKTLDMRFERPVMEIL